MVWMKTHWSFFTSDNGPWLVQRLNGRFCRCFTSREVYLLGRRSPRSGCFPYAGPNSAVYAARHDATMDILPTFLNMAGIPLPEGVTLDGMDQTPCCGNRGSLHVMRCIIGVAAIYWQFVKVLGRFISVPLPILIPGMLFGAPGNSFLI